MNNEIKEAEKVLQDEFHKVDEIEEYNTSKVMNAFYKNELSESDLYGTTGYGYGDAGRDKIENIYKDIFKCEDALVRSQFISGTHAITKTLFGLLRPNDNMLSITGMPYDTLHEVIGIKDNNSSLKSFLISFNKIDLVNNDFDYEKIDEYLKNNNPKIIHIQRSKGYDNRESLSITKLEKVIKFIKERCNSIVMVDNCYCEFVSKKEPTEVGADIVVGSLIKNLGAGMCSNGGYVVGKKSLVKLVAESLNVPGEGKEVGPSINFNKMILMGLFLAPSVVSSSLKINILTSYLLDKRGYNVSPLYNEEHSDIVLSIVFNDKDKLISFIRGIQNGSPIDSNVTLIPSPMPGYDDDIIMASGSFTQGSSIEISCDGPIRPPYIAYLQGGLTYQSAKFAIKKAIENIDKL